MDTLNVLGPATEPGQLPFKLEGVVSTGKYKAVQEWVLSFLTQRGSLLPLPTFGTDFLYYLGSGAIRTDADVQTHFGMASQQALSDISESEDDFVVTKAILTNYSIVEKDLKRILILEIAFEFSDGTTTRANLGVN